MPVETSSTAPASAQAPALGTTQQLRGLLQIRWLQLCGLTALLAWVGGFGFYTKLCVLDSDLWWHLKVGDWIIENAAMPHTGILSRTAANRPWVAYSWGYEVLLSRAYAWFGLIGIGVFGVLLTIMVAYSVYWMMLRLSGRFWAACAGTGVICSAFLFNGMPRPFFFSIALFAVTLALLLQANRTGNAKPLYWLVPIFCVWVNLHIQFTYGLAVTGLFVAANVALEVAKRIGILPAFLQEPSLRSRDLIVILGACFLATLIGPNFYHPYQALLTYSKQKFSYAVIIELQPLSFRGFSNYEELFIAAAAFFAIGWEKKIDVFKLAVIVIATVLAFRTMRDAWFVCVSAAACMADFPANEAEKDNSENWFENVGVAAAVAILLVALAPSLDFNQRALDRTISSVYPVNAINFLRRNPVPGPLYNNLNWGGFLMWYMPQYPVAIDGRNDLYGDELDKLFYDSQSAQNSYLTDPYLNEAGLVLLDSKLPLAKVLTVDPRFQLIFHDETATVYARR